jgi:CheY-like chemotaxis protein
VLVIEDDVDLRDALTDVLELAGFRVTTASDGHTGLAMLRAGLAPDAIVLDLMMPVMDGYAFRAAQRSDPALARIPTVVSTADRRARPEGPLAGVAAFVPKPMSADVIVRTLRDVVAR